jgi:hypothetical protein
MYQSCTKEKASLCHSALLEILHIPYLFYGLALKRKAHLFLGRGRLSGANSLGYALGIKNIFFVFLCQE